MAISSKNLEAFEAMREELVSEHPDEFVVFYDGKLVGYYDSEDEAIFGAIRSHGLKLGTFLVKKCVTADRDHIEFHSRVSFR